MSARRVKITNAEFVAAVFNGATPEQIWTASFTHDKPAWTGRVGGEIPEAVDRDNYTAVAVFRAGAVSREAENFAAAYAVVIDDIADPSRLQLQGSYVLGTSPGNYQVGYLLSTPVTDLEAYRQLMRLLGRLGLLGNDKHGNNAVRVVRLPVGVNTKAERIEENGGVPPACAMADWQPERRYSFETLQRVFGAMEQPREKVDDPDGVLPLGMGREGFSALRVNIRDGVNLHNSLRDIGASLVAQGVNPGQVKEVLIGLHDGSAARVERPEDWIARGREIDRIVASAVEKFAPVKEEGEKDWPEPSDLWAPAVGSNITQGMVPRTLWEMGVELREVNGFDNSAFCMAALAVCAGMIDDAIKINPMPNDPTYLESARLWVTLVGEPSTKKSPVLGKAVAQVATVISAEIDPVNEQREQNYDARHAEWRALPAAERRAQPEPLREPALRLTVSDFTPEALAKVLVANPRGVLIKLDEASSFIGGAGAYKSGAGGTTKEISKMLELYQGDSTTVDRSSTGYIKVPNWGASIVGGSQPEVLRDIFSKMKHNGFAERFIWVNVKESPERIDRPLDTQRVQAYGELLLSLYRMRPVEVFGGAGLALERAPAPVRYSATADTVRKRVVAELDSLVRLYSKEVPRLAQQLGKAETLYSRLVLVMHCIHIAESNPGRSPNHQPGLAEVSVETAEMARGLMLGFVIPHARAFHTEVLGGAVSPAATHALKIADRIIAHDLKELTPTKLTSLIKDQRFKDPKDVVNALELLQANGWVRRVETKRGPGDGARRLPAWRFEVNPRAVVVFKERAALVAATLAEIHRLVKSGGKDFG